MTCTNGAGGAYRRFTRPDGANMRIVRGALLLALVSVSITSCNVFDNRTVRPPDPGTKSARVHLGTDWDRPFHHGKTVEDPGSAQELVTFELAPVSGVGTLHHVVVTDPEWLPTAKNRAVAFVFREADAPTDPFFVQQSHAELTQSDLESMVDCHEGEVGCSTKGWTLTPLPTGENALLLDGAVGRGFATSISWIRDGIHFEVIGPKDTFTASEPLEVAYAIELTSLSAHLSRSFGVGASVTALW